MPFIPKRRFYDRYLRSACCADTVLLLLAVKPITTLPPTTPLNARTHLYYATKHFYLKVERSSIFSISILQAGMLLAFYELGHGIYPRAYTSFGACARYAYALCINADGVSKLRDFLTLVEAEARHRV